MRFLAETALLDGEIRRDVAITLDTEAVSYTHLRAHET